MRLTFDVFSKTKRPLTACATSVFPVGLCRQSIHTTCLLLLGQVRKLLAELDSIFPRNLIDRMHRTEALAHELLLELTRVGSNHLLVLTLGDFRHAKIIE